MRTISGGGVRTQQATFCRPAASPAHPQRHRDHDGTRLRTGPRCTPRCSGSRCTSGCLPRNAPARLTGRTRNYRVGRSAPADRPDRLRFSLTLPTQEAFRAPVPKAMARKRRAPVRAAEQHPAAPLLVALCLQHWPGFASLRRSGRSMPWRQVCLTGPAGKSSTLVTVVYRSWRSL